MSVVLTNGIATFTMHDPKLSASVAQQQLMMSEALLDNVSGQGLLRPHYYLTNEHYEANSVHGEMPSLSRAVDEVAEMTSHLSFLQRMKELGVGVDATRGSILSDLPSQYNYTDLFYARYAALHSDAGHLSSYTDRLLSASLYTGRHCTAAPGVSIKDYSPLVPPLRTLATSSSRAPDTLSPLHISTTMASSSPPSSLSSPSPHRQSSVSPDSCTDFYSHRRHKPSSSLTRPNVPLTLYEERTLGPYLPNPRHLWQTPTSNLALRPPPLLSLYEPFVTSMDTRSTVGHFLDYYLTSSSLLTQNFQRHHPAKESSFNGVHSSLSDTRSSPGKELTTKTWKQDRARERQEVSSVLEADKEHLERLSNVKKTASTQTQCSSFSFENQLAPIYYSHDMITHDKLCASAALPSAYPLPPPPLIQYTAQFPSPPSASSLHPPLSGTSLITNSSRHLLLHSSDSSAASVASQALMHMRSSPPMLSLPPYHSTTPPPKYGEHTGSRVDVQHAPLNLSLSSVSLASTANKGSASHLPMGGSSAERDQQEANPRGQNKNRGSLESGTQDEAIEEHFRRSLGKCYNEPSPPKKVTVHVSDKICSVDDHFARALGDQMWTEIKSRSEPNIDPSTVDAHFAKALGATMWKKLKAENKLVDELSSSSPPQQHPSCSTSSLQTSLAT